MDEQEIQKLIQELILSKTGIGWTIPGSENRKDVEIFIRKHFGSAKLKEENTELKTKLFIYEKIISNSNFSPMIIPAKNNEKKDN